MQVVHLDTKAAHLARERLIPTIETQDAVLESHPIRSDKVPV
jgi:hypothetical protein